MCYWCRRRCGVTVILTDIWRVVTHHGIMVVAVSWLLGLLYGRVLTNFLFLYIWLKMLVCGWVASQLYCIEHWLFFFFLILSVWFKVVLEIFGELHCSLRRSSTVHGASMSNSGRSYIVLISRNFLGPPLDYLHRNYFIDVGLVTLLFGSCFVLDWLATAVSIFHIWPPIQAATASLLAHFRMI